MSRQTTGPYNINTYFLTCHQTGETLIIDPGGQAERLSIFLKETQLTPKALVLTHGHADQFFAADEFKLDWDIPYCLHQDDVDFFAREEVREATRKAVGLPPPADADLILSHGQKIRFGRQTLTVIHTPGHTPGSCCFLCKDLLFTGDTLFVGEGGRTDLPGGDLPLMIQSIEARILPLPKETIIHPGHHHTGMPKTTTLAREIRENIHITDFILDP